MSINMSFFLLMSYSPHPVHQRVMLALLSKYIQNTFSPPTPVTLAQTTTFSYLGDCTNLLLFLCLTKVMSLLCSTALNCSHFTQSKAKFLSMVYKPHLHDLASCYLSDFMTVWYGQSDRQINQQNSLEIDLNKCGQLILTKCKSISMEE